jgi:sodium-dependent dicarboxylate transporter 2/3/5
MLNKIGMGQGLGLWIGLSGLSGVITNFMSDAGTTALLGPIVIPMGIMTQVPGEPWAVGLAVAFATSFAHVLIVGTPNNAIVYGLGTYPDTGERAIHPMDFVKYGFILFLLSLAVVWIIGFMGIFKIIGFPNGILEIATQAMQDGGN